MPAGAEFKKIFLDIGGKSSIMVNKKCVAISPERIGFSMQEQVPKRKGRTLRALLIVLGALAVLAVAGYFIARGVARSLIQSEISTRSDWEIDTGDVADREAAQQVTVYTDPVEATIEIKPPVEEPEKDEEKKEKESRPPLAVVCKGQAE